MTRTSHILAVLLLSVSGSALADPGWILTTADFKQQPVSLESLDGKGARVTHVGDGSSRVVSFDQLLQLERPSSAPLAAQGRFALGLAGGDRILGEPAGFVDEMVLWKNPAVGDVQVPLKDCRLLLRAGRTIENPDLVRTEDYIHLANGDSAKGIITDIGPDGVKISADGADLALPLDAIDYIHFAQAGQPKENTGVAFRVRLTDGSFLTVQSVESNGSELTLAFTPQDKRKLPLTSVAGIEQLNGPVSWLSSRRPSQVVQTPYYGTTTWPTRMDMTVGGRPITFAGRTYARGIGVHSYSRIDYALDGKYKAFRTQYAMATEDKRQYADVTVRIRIDDKPVHERRNFKAEELSKVVVVDVPAGAKVLTLEVDYGAALDIQDRFNWIEPALLREKPKLDPPATRPTTRPATRPSTRPATRATTAPAL